MVATQITDAVRMDENNVDALSFRGNVELKADDWLKAKETFKAVQQLTDGKDAYSLLALVRTLILSFHLVI